MRHAKPGFQVVFPGRRGTGQVVSVDPTGTCEVVWRPSGKREHHSQTELVWRGLVLRTADRLQTARVVALGKRGTVRVRLENGTCCWVSADEFLPRQPKDVVENNWEEKTYD
jgi:hypothetical protein